MDAQIKHRIEIQKKTGPGSSTSSWEDVSNLNELKQALAQYSSHTFYLEEYRIYFEECVPVGGPKAAEEFTQEDFDWLIEEPPEGKSRLVDRYIASTALRV